MDIDDSRCSGQFRIGTLTGKSLKAILKLCFLINLSQTAIQTHTVVITADIYMDPMVTVI